MVYKDLDYDIIMKCVHKIICISARKWQIEDKRYIDINLHITRGG